MATAGPVFIYGTLLDRRIFARLSGLAPLRRAVPGRLDGHRRVVLRGTPYPTLIRAAGEAVAGLLLPRIPAAAYHSLAAYEGASYVLCPVRVATRSGPRRARAWVAQPRRVDVASVWPGQAPSRRGQGSCHARM